VNRFPAACLFCFRVAGMSPVEFYLWILNEGAELEQRMIADTNVYILPGSGQLSTAEVFLHTNKLLEKPADLEGLKIRSAGEGAEVLKMLGASMVFMPGTEVYESIQRGVLDAAELGNPTTNWRLALQEVADYMWLSGVRQPLQYVPTSVNRDAWEKLPDDLKLIVKEFNKAQPMREYSRYTVSDAEFTQKFKDYGVNVLPLPAEIENAMKEAADKYYAEKAAADPFYAEVVRSQDEFQKALRESFERL